MFEAASMLYLYVEAPLHAGSGRGLAAVDLPIQRERVTGYPFVQGSGVKGALRADACARKADGAEQDKLRVIFGPDSENASDHAGAVSFGDARLLLFPVRSLAGVFAWTTSVNVLARFARDVQIMGGTMSWSVPTEAPGGQDAWTTTHSDLVVEAGNRKKLVLEEFSFTAQSQSIVDEIATWIVSHVLPQDDVYGYWRNALPKRLVVLPEDDFRDFTLFATEVATRIRLDSETKTVQPGALWTEESLPTDTVLYVPVQASRGRSTKTQDGNVQNLLAAWATKGGAKEILKYVAGLGIKRLQLGGDETIGRGLVSLRFGEVRDNV